MHLVSIYRKNVDVKALIGGGIGIGGFCAFSFWNRKSAAKKKAEAEKAQKERVVQKIKAEEKANQLDEIVALQRKQSKDEKRMKKQMRREGKAATPPAK
ncbi:unnamed protein product [Arabis nemorensis]|uniref:Uncharacterized protein n=1 Tax=Arabis nemorensis TaxID=586526 RepID=A0A565B2A7_9BRAS|nr:unnamed protein product [Arabis nemorensis]